MAGGLTVITCSSLGFDLEEHRSAQTIVFSGAQPGMQPPSAPRWTEPGEGVGEASSSQPPDMLCGVGTLTSAHDGNIWVGSRTN